MAESWMMTPDLPDSLISCKKRLLPLFTLVSLSLSPCDIERVAEIHYVSHQYSRSTCRSHVCVSFCFFFAPMCPCRERYGAADNILFMRADSFCAALCFQPVHERNCNYGTQPPPLTHANMHHNWPIHTGKCLLNGLPISSQQADHYV